MILNFTFVILLNSFTIYLCAVILHCQVSEHNQTPKKEKEIAFFI